MHGRNMPAAVRFPTQMGERNERNNENAKDGTEVQLIRSVLDYASTPLLRCLRHHSSLYCSLLQLH